MECGCSYSQRGWPVIPGASGDSGFGDTERCEGLGLCNDTSIVHFLLCCPQSGAEDAVFCGGQGRYNRKSCNMSSVRQITLDSNPASSHCPAFLPKPVSSLASMPHVVWAVGEAVHSLSARGIPC